MTTAELKTRLGAVVMQPLPLPGSGNTAERLRLLAETAREDVSLAKLAEAHWDAVAILAEAGRTPEPGMLYAVWASELPGQGLRIDRTKEGYELNGTKPFCSGLGLVDRALVSVRLPQEMLVEVDLRGNEDCVEADLEMWKVDAFRATQTGAITFRNTRLSSNATVGPSGWYIERPGFWHGACGPAACWAGGVAGLLDFALISKRDDPHTLAHLGAMQAAVWGMYSLLRQAGVEIDAAPCDETAAQIRALQLRHLIEKTGTEVLQRFSRAYGPYPLSMNEESSRRYQEVGLYMRQSHAERDLESLGRLIRMPSTTLRRS
jgi:alkylation response protein AidB-like acyl-CoA dehydrogenase